MMVIIIAWAVISAPAFVYNLYKMYHLEETWDILLYPRLHRFWIKEGLVGAWVKVMDIFYTIFFLPAVVIYFILVLSMMLLALAICWIDVAIGKIKKKIKR